MAVKLEPDGLNQPSSAEPADLSIDITTPTTSSVDTSTINLLDVVKIIPTPEDGIIDKAYVLKSSTVPAPVDFVLMNCATNMSVRVGFNGPESVQFVQKPTISGDVGIGGVPLDGITLQPQQIFELQVRFLKDKLDTLEEGINESALIFALSAVNLTVTPEKATVEISCPDDIPLPPAAQETWIDCETAQVHAWPPPANWVRTAAGCWQPIEPPPAQTWIDCETGETHDGLPPEGWIKTDAGCWKSPPPPAGDISIDIVWTEQEPIVTSAQATAQMKLFVDFQGDDPTLYTWDWNFDVNGQGKEFGDTTAQETIALYPMTTQDLSNLSREGHTTRRVKVIASKGGKFVASREETIWIADPRLSEDLIEPPIVEDRKVAKDITTLDSKKLITE